MSSGERVVNARNPRNVGAPPGRRAQDTGTSCRTALWVSVAVTARRHRVSLMKLPWPSAVSMLINLPVPGGCFNVPLRLSRSASTAPPPGSGDSLVPGARRRWNQARPGRIFSRRGCRVHVYIRPSLRGSENGGTYFCCSHACPAFRPLREAAAVPVSSLCTTLAVLAFLIPRWDRLSCPLWSLRAGVGVCGVAPPDAHQNVKHHFLLAVTPETNETPRFVSHWKPAFLTRLFSPSLYFRRSDAAIRWVRMTFCGRELDTVGVPRTRPPGPRRYHARHRLGAF